MKTEQLILYRDFEEGDLLTDMVWLAENYADDFYNLSDKAGLLYDCMHRLLDMAGRYGYLANLLVNKENSYSCSAEIRGSVEGSVNLAALHDIRIFKEFYDYDLQTVAKALGAEEFSIVLFYEGNPQESKVYNTRIRDRICDLAQRFCLDHTPEEMKQTLTEFYQEYGVGRFGLHKAFRIEKRDGHAEIVPITNIAHVKLDDLVGYELAKQKLVDNTEAFVSGKEANNCLLYGDAGTGKSTSIKAIANQYYDRGLRLIEVYKHQFCDLNDVIEQIKNRNYKFIIYMDDLSFEEFEIEYKYLKAVIEGGLETKPDNVLIYATSNRRHLIKETWNDRDDVETDNGMHRSDTMQEKLSLVNRFGVTISYSRPSRNEFNDIVLGLAKKHPEIGLTEQELLAEANKWELSHGGVSGRTAQQFMNYLLGKA